MAYCDVVPYDIAALKNLLAKPGHVSPAVIDKKVHTIFFEEYFATLGAKTIVAENEYIDRDYLEDFASYYVKCFDDYSRKCCRLHFFDIPFTQGDFDALLEGAAAPLSERHLQEHYLGFMVVKPLPQTVIGRTCLRTYPPNGKRHYASTRDYDVNLVGVRLKVKGTLAFQEQDSVVAACATSALWSAFHSTGKLFQHPIPTPVEITRAATENEPSDTRHFPNSGLQSTQIARGIRYVGLEPFLVRASDPNVLRSTVYGYLGGRLPIILVFALFDDIQAPGRWQFIGRHGVALTGFRLGRTAATPEAMTGFELEATRIDELYVHDDGVGPFARVVMDEKSELLVFPDGTSAHAWTMHASWRRQRTGTLGVRALPQLLLVPLYPKIRIPYEIAEAAIRDFDRLLAPVLGATLGGERLVWDLRLAIGSDLKSTVISEGILRGPGLRRFLERPLPRFVWRGSARRSGNLVLDLLLDATDVEQGNLVCGVVEYDAPLSGAIRAAAPILAPAAARALHLFQYFTASRP